MPMTHNARGWTRRVSPDWAPTTMLSDLFMRHRLVLSLAAAPAIGAHGYCFGVHDSGPGIAAQAMGSTLKVQSTPGAGSDFAFAVELPAAPGHLRDLDERQSGFADFECACTATPLTVLLVEDNPVNQLYCQAVLEQVGHEVHVADDGLQAVRIAQERRFGLILVDCHMPVLDGFEATRRIRYAELQRGTPRSLSAGSAGACARWA